VAEQNVISHFEKKQLKPQCLEILYIEVIINKKLLFWYQCGKLATQQRALLASSNIVFKQIQVLDLTVFSQPSTEVFLGRKITEMGDD